jgi:hypothetical protein
MTKIMSACLIMLLLWNNQSQGMNTKGMTLEQKIALQQERYEWSLSMVSSYSKKPKKQVIEHIDCDLLLGGKGSRIHNYSMEGEVAFGIICSNSSINFEILQNLSKLKLVMRGAGNNSIIIDATNCFLPSIDLDIDKFSGNNRITIYTWDDISVEGIPHCNNNSLVIHSPVRKLIWPTITVGLILWLGSKFFGK